MKERKKLIFFWFCALVKVVSKVSQLPTIYIAKESRFAFAGNSKHKWMEFQMESRSPALTNAILFSEKLPPIAMQCDATSKRNLLGLEKSRQQKSIVAH